MDLRNLGYFTEVVRHGGFARATEAAHASQSTLSKAVAQLEDELGTRLLERERRGVRLTQAGEVVQRHALALLAGARQLRGEVEAIHDLEGGELRLGIPPVGSNVLFAPLLKRYRERYPRVRIHLLERGSRALEQAVFSGELELAATLSPHAPGLDAQPVCDDPMLVVLPQAHARSRARRFRFAWLAQSPLILFEKGFALNELIPAACARHGITLMETVRSGQVDFIVSLVAAGTGIALLPRVAVVDRALAGCVTVPLAGPDLRWKLVLAWRSGAALSPAARAWLELVAGNPAPPGQATVRRGPRGRRHGTPHPA